MYSEFSLVETRVRQAKHNTIADLYEQEWGIDLYFTITIHYQGFDTLADD